MCNNRNLGVYYQSGIVSYGPGTVWSGSVHDRWKWSTCRPMRWWTRDAVHQRIQVSRLDYSELQWQCFTGVNTKKMIYLFLRPDCFRANWRSATHSVQLTWLTLRIREPVTNDVRAHHADFQKISTFEFHFVDPFHQTNFLYWQGTSRTTRSFSGSKELPYRSRGLPCFIDLLICF